MLLRAICILICVVYVIALPVGTFCNALVKTNSSFFFNIKKVAG
jgi:hypothetical protein